MFYNTDCQDDFWNEVFKEDVLLPETRKKCTIIHSDTMASFNSIGFTLTLINMTTGPLHNTTKFMSVGIPHKQ